MSANQRIYVVEYAGDVRLIRAATPAAARNHVARHQIIVNVAGQDDLVRFIGGGVEVEETTTDPVQKEIGEVVA